jgi:FMN phosphatase YigB (HAD superfamily)
MAIVVYVSSIITLYIDKAPKSKYTFTGTVLEDLNFPDTLSPVVLSEEEGIEKPSNEFFLKALESLNNSHEQYGGRILPSQCVHIGDELIW